MHHCPECYSICHCNGDIDDIDFGDESRQAIRCLHYRDCEKDWADGDFPDDDFYEGDD